MPRSRRRGEAAQAAAAALGNAAPVEYEIDLHGLRARDALQMLERHIETNHAAGSPWIHVIHGRGTGKLRAAVRDSLDTNRLVRRYYFAPPAQGGDGVTIAELKRRQQRQAH